MRNNAKRLYISFEKRVLFLITQQFNNNW